ncbi:hypothetical protein NUSPORA_01771 [Nucleospora cyclopteri]
MSQFFQNFDQETKQTQQKSKKFINEEVESVSKADKKRIEIETKAEALIALTNQKQFEKNFRKFIQDLKKFMKKSEKIPTVVEDLFKSQKISKQSQRLIDDFKENVHRDQKETESEEKEEEIIRKPKRHTLEEVLLMHDNTAKIRELERIYAEGDGDAVFRPLFFAYSKDKATVKMIKLVSEYCKKNADIDIEIVDRCAEKIYTDLKECNYSDYLDFVEGAGLENRILQFKYFVENNCISTDNPLFKPLYLININKIDEAVSLINYETFSQKDYEIQVFDALGKILLINCKFSEALKCFGLIKDVKYCKVELMLLSILFLKEESNPNFLTDAFKEFLDKFRNLDSNPFLLKSENPENELMRAFYFLNMGDIEFSSKILADAFSINDETQLKNLLSSEYTVFNE